MTTDLSPHECLMLNVAMLDFPSTAQRATALALAHIAGAQGDRGTIGMGVLPPADAMKDVANHWMPEPMDVDQLNWAMLGLIASRFLSVPLMLPGMVYRLNTEAMPERFQCPDDAPQNFDQGVVSPTYRYGERA